MRDLLRNILPWLALAFALFGMRDADSAFSVSLLILIVLFWAINWLLHHISFRWLRYLRYLLLILIGGAIIIVPELRAVFEGVIPHEPSTAIVLSIVTLVVWGVMCLARPTQQSTPR